VGDPSLAVVWPLGMVITFLVVDMGKCLADAFVSLVIFCSLRILVYLSDIHLEAILLPVILLVINLPDVALVISV
jgi:hypothetical protein